MSTNGSDEGEGTIAEPFQTVMKAFASPADRIVVAAGDYATTGQLVLSGSRELIGGVQDGDFKADKLSVSRVTLSSGLGKGGLVLEDNARVAYMTLTGGYWSIEARDNSIIDNCDFEGSTGASIRVQGDASPTIVKCEFITGLSGVEVTNNADVLIDRCYFIDHRGRGIVVKGDSTATIVRTEVRRSDAEGISFFENATGLVQNSFVHRSTDAGIRCQGTSPQLIGNIVSLNEDGILLEAGSQAIISNNTIAKNRQAGLRIDESLPKVRQNIFAENDDYGVSEAEQTVGDEISENIFAKNILGSYLDAGTTPVLTAEAINTSLVNDGTQFGNLVEDEFLFVDSANEDFRLADGASAIDRLALNDAGFEYDAMGVPRLFDVAGVGNEQDDVLDIGALEAGQTTSYRFGSFLDGWELVDVLAWEPISLRSIPGRIEFGGIKEESYGGAIIEGMPNIQSPDTLLQMRHRIASAGPDIAGMPEVRMRQNGLLNQLSFSSAFVPAQNQVLAPPESGRDYYQIIDFQNGSLRTNPGTTPFYYTLSLDMLEFGRSPARTKAMTPFDFEEIDATEIDRASFDSQFSPYREFTFDQDAEGWQFFDYVSLFDVPTHGHDIGRGALWLAPSSNTCFGFWSSARMEMTPGTIVRITSTLSCDEPDERIVSDLRMRFGSWTFEYYQTMTTASLAAGYTGVIPDADGNDLVMYAVIPDDIDENGFYLAFDLMGFNPTISSQPIYLENVRIDTAPGPLVP
ncbi:right-handed parallel beta-helix repeat-containing protein [bacterium]|nr:right-handed parallel beta-helix repeat-containing protein [bacterium]